MKNKNNKKLSFKVKENAYSDIYCVQFSKLYSHSWNIFNNEVKQ